MHDQLLGFAAQLITDPPDPNSVKVAALTLAGLVVTAAATVLVAFRTPREPRRAVESDEAAADRRGDERYHRALTAQLQDRDRRLVKACADLTEANTRVAVLERFMWRHHFDPEKIVTGDEEANDAAI